MTVMHNGNHVALARSADNDVLGDATRHIRLMADSDATGGALSTIRARLGPGDPGAVPHHHARSSEMFYVLSGEVAVLADDQVVTAGEGDLLVVPPRMPHAFAATPEAGTELLIVITPGVQRFDYFRQLLRIATGAAEPDSLAALQEVYDTWFLPSPTWDAHLTG